MEVLYFLVVISVVGVAAVFWLIKHEQNAEGVPLKDLGSSAGEVVPPSSNANFLLNLLSRFGLGKKTDRTPESEIPHLPQPPEPFALGNLFAKEHQKEEPSAREFVSSAEVGTPLAGGVGEEVKLSADEEKKIDREIELMAQLDEIKEQNKNLDRLFKEKSAALEKAEESLENELRNRKEFNKVKDILEKELKESRDKSRDLQVELGAAKAESENYQKRVNVLAEKVAELERQVIQRGDEVANLTKRLQTFASPATAATPPQAEKPEIKTVIPQETVPLVGDPLLPKDSIKPQPYEPPVKSNEEPTPGIIDLSGLKELKEEKTETSEGEGKDSQNT